MLALHGCTRGLSSCGHGLLTVVSSLFVKHDPVVVKHGLSRRMACEIFPDHEWIHWTTREDPLPPAPPTQWILMEADVLNCRDL